MLVSVACDRCGVPVDEEIAEDVTLSSTLCGCGGVRLYRPPAWRSRSAPNINLRPIPRQAARATQLAPYGDCRHEAAHAAVAYLTGTRIEELTPTRLRVNESDLADNPFNAALIAAGPEADDPNAIMSDADAGHALSRDDLADARELLRSAPGLVDEIASALAESGHLSGPEVEAIARSIARAA